MKKRSLLSVLGIVYLAAAVISLPSAGAVAAEAKYPTRGIEIICGFGVGSGTDILSRKVADLAPNYIGVPFHVVNAPGSSGMVGLRRLLAQPADGYTMGIITSSGLIGLSTGKFKESLSEFTPLALFQLPAVWILVQYDAPYKDFGEFLEAAKTKEIRVIGSGARSGQALHVGYINKKKGTKFVFVPMAKQAERNAAMLGKHVEACTDEIGDIYEELVATKKIRPLVVFYPERDPRLPNVASSWEYDLPISVPTFRGFLLKSATPEPIVKKLTAAMKQVHDDTQYQTYVKDLFLVPGGFKNDVEFAKFLDEKSSLIRKTAEEIGWIK